MSKSSAILALTGALLVAHSACAQELTVRESTLLQSQIAKAELEAKVREAQNRGTGGQSDKPVVVSPGRVDEIYFVGHYGIENDVKADFLLNGGLITFSKKGKTEIGGWHLDELSPTRARLCRKGVNGKKFGCKDIPLSAERSAYSKPAGADTFTGVPGEVPPIRQIAGPK